MKKRIIAALLAVCLMVELLPAMAFAEPAAGFAGGDGSAGSPYEISTAEQFLYFADQIAQGKGTGDYYVLSEDIDLSEQNWGPICKNLNEYYANQCFVGVFDGQGHTITYQIETKETIGRYHAYGLFGIVEGTIKNLNVEGSITIGGYVEGTYIGGLCGWLAGSMSNCSSGVAVTLTDTASTNQSDFGGLVGNLDGGTIENCVYSGTIVSKQNERQGELYAGGIAGISGGGTIISCKNEGMLDFFSVPAAAVYVGGIVGLVNGFGGVTSLVENCYNEGEISSSGWAGGIANSVSAYGSGTAKIVNSYSIGTVTGGEKAAAIAPIVNGSGSGTASIENCYYLAGEGETVGDENGEPVADMAELYEKLTQNSDTGVWVQDADGTVRLDWEIPLVISLPESAQGISDGMAAFIGASIVLVGGSAAIAYYYREALPIWKLAGTAKLPDGTPAANAVIELWRDGALVKTLTTDENGAFAARVAKGAYEAVVTWEQAEETRTQCVEVTAEQVFGEAVRQEIILEPESPAAAA